MAGALVIINLFVIPAFAGVFKSFKAELPLMTRVLIGFSDFTVNYWLPLLGLIVAIVFGLRAWVGTRDGRMIWDKYKLRLPIVGSTIRKAALARFARSFSLSLRSGLPVIQAFGVVAEVVDNAYIAEKITGMRSGVERGDSLLRTAAATRIFTPVVLQMIAVGEESGSVDDLLLEIA